MSLDISQVRELGKALVSDALIVFPVRHHSPACAWQLQRLFAEHTPSAVLVEGPRSFTPLVRLLAHPEAQAPLAIYTYAVQSAGHKEHLAAPPRRAAYYPFCDYSPEIVALREAAARDIPARFIDLDFVEQCALERSSEENEGRSLLDERHYQRSRHLEELARKLGCRDHEELWEHLFEVDSPALTVEEHIARVAAYCLLSRMDSTPEELATEGTLHREAEMVHHVRDALAHRQHGAGPVLAVVGGFHAVVMPELLANPPPRPKVSRDGFSDDASALIRYSFDRLDRLNGYSAGMTSPAWHQTLWDRMQRQRNIGSGASSRVRTDAAMEVLFDIAMELRTKHGVPLPTPALAAAYEQTLRLTRLRQRSAPLRTDVLDAITSCFVKGDADADGAIVKTVVQRMLSGSRMGKVPPGTQTPPLVKDADWRLRRQRLKVDDPQPRKLVLNLYRRPEHRMTSRLLHGFTLLGIPFAVRTAGPDFVNGIGLDRLQESWEYSYSAATEAALVEASIYGVTVPLAVANRFTERLDRMQADGLTRGAGTAAMLMTQACLLGLHDHLPRTAAQLRAAVSEDGAFESVVTAAAALGILWESREPLEARDLPDVPALLQSVYERAIYLGRELRGQQCPPEHLIDALMKLRELLVSGAGRSLDASLFWSVLEDLQLNHDIARVRGAAAGLLFSSGHLGEEALGKTLDGHFQGMLAPADSVGFLAGLLLTAREVAWQQPRLLEVLDGLLRQWREDVFVANLPEMRLAFAGMTPKETDRISGAIAKLHGAEDLGPLVMRDIDEESMQRNLELSRMVTDLLIGDGLETWSAK